MAGAKKKADKGGKGKKGGKKGGGGRAQAVIDGVPMAAMTRDQLEGHVTRLKDELDREREERNFIQLELERTQRLWEVATQSLDQERSVARLKDAEMAAAEESHQHQMKVVQHKMKNLIGEHDDVVANLQVASQETLGSFQLSNQRQEEAIATKLQTTREQLAETEARYLATIADLKVTQSRELQEERERLLQEATALTKRQEQKLGDVTQQLELKRKTELEQLEAQKNKFLEGVMEKHQGRILELKEYYTQITEANLKDIAQLKTRVEEQASREGAVQRRIGAVEEERTRLRLQNETLQQKVAESSRALQRSQNLEQNLKSSYSRLRTAAEEKRELQCHIELLMQKTDQVERERAQLYEQLVQVVGEVRQRSEMRNLVLECKLTQLSDQLEKREAVLSEVLAATNMDPASVVQVTRQLEHIIEEKNESIAALRTEVATMRRLYADLLDRPRPRPK